MFVSHPEPNVQVGKINTWSLLTMFRKGLITFFLSFSCIYASANDIEPVPSDFGYQKWASEDLLSADSDWTELLPNGASKLDALMFGAHRCLGVYWLANMHEFGRFKDPDFIDQHKTVLVLLMFDKIYDREPPGSLRDMAINDSESFMESLSDNLDQNAEKHFYGYLNYLDEQTFDQTLSSPQAKTIFTELMGCMETGLDFAMEFDEEKYQ